MINWKNWEGNSRGIILGYYSDIHMEELRKITKTSVRIAGLRAEISTRDLANAKQVMLNWILEKQGERKK
jgi:hypothetical protein